MNKTTFGPTAAFTGVLLLFLSACATVRPSDGSAERYAAVISRYPQADDELRVPKLSVDAARSVRASSSPRSVFIMVHPGYSFFFTMGAREKERYWGARYRLMELQFLNEERFIAEQAHSGNIIILIVPGNYRTDSSYPRAYLSYLNNTAAASPRVFYLPSMTSNNGSIAADDLVSLYGFLHALKSETVLVGGGYIGRCQKEFYNQLATYAEKAQTFIVREVSAVSPEDVSEKEASAIETGLEQRDFAPLGRFLARKLGDDVNIMPLMPDAGHRAAPPSPALPDH